MLRHISKRGRCSFPFNFISTINAMRELPSITSRYVDAALIKSLLTFCLLFQLVSKQLYIILIRPERNVRQSMMPVRYSAMNKNSTGNAPTSMMAAIMVTAATCNQNEKIEKQTTMLVPEERKGKFPFQLYCKLFSNSTKKRTLS